MKHSFSTFKEWNQAIANRNMVIFTDPPTHEGMHEDDAFQPIFAGLKITKEIYCTPEMVQIDFGMFCTDEEGGLPTAVIFDTHEEFLSFMHEGDDQQGN